MARQRSRCKQIVVSQNDFNSDKRPCPYDSSASKGSSDGNPKLSRRERKRLNRVKRNELNASKVQMTDGEKAHYVALDCEMVGVGYKGQESVVARVTIINWDVEIILDCFVRCDQFVVDYRTHVSGITKDDLESEYAISFCECQWLVAELIHDKVLVGHALKNDLRVLGINHPWYDTRDTATYEPFMKQRFEDGILWPRKLKDLAKEILGREIQMPGHPHLAFEDALAALDLYKKKRAGWEKVMEYKVNKMVQMCMPITQDDVVRWHDATC